MFYSYFEIVFEANILQFFGKNGWLFRITLIIMLILLTSPKIIIRIWMKSFVSKNLSIKNERFAINFCQWWIINDPFIGVSTHLWQVGGLFMHIFSVFKNSWSGDAHKKVVKFNSRFICYNCQREYFYEKNSLYSNRTVVEI